MNLFVLHKDPSECAKLHCDKHVVKMVLETAQILCTVMGEYCDVPYKSTHVNHPCTKWCRANASNYAWCVDLFLSLSDEYTFRYKKVHKSAQVLMSSEYMHLVGANTRLIEEALGRGELMAPALAMSNIDTSGYLHTWDDAVQYYRKYYCTKNGDWIRNYTGRDVPDWLKI